jgi:TPR repeat protein
MQKDASPIPSASAATANLPLTATEPPIATRTAVVPQSESPEPATLLSRADLLFSTGDVTSARLFYQRAADAGNGDAALRLAETYDPNFLHWAKLFTMRGDPAAAAFWYGRARELGALMPPGKTEPHITRTDNKVAPKSEPPARAIEPAALLSRGDSLLNTGDVASARLFYQRAADSGNGEAALRLGETYDPNFIQWAKLPFVPADSAAALFWYQRARELGVAEAETLLKDMQNKIATTMK